MIPALLTRIETAPNSFATASTSASDAPALPVVQNVDAEVHDGVLAIRDALVRQLYLPVRWSESMQALSARGVTAVAECGPGKVLTGLAKRIDKALDARALGAPADFDAALAAWQD